jgi:citrate synthase
LPAAGELDELRATLTKERSLDESLIRLVRSLSNQMGVGAAGAMRVLRTAISAAQANDPDGEDDGDEANLRRSYRLIAQTPQLVAAVHRIGEGLDPIPAREDLGVAANFLWALHGEEPDRALAHDLDLVFLLYADHTLNASTFAARVAAATLADLHGAITAAVATLQGPLHGGAIAGAKEMFDQIGSADRADAWVRDRIANKQKIMGFGHRVYRTWDPRSLLLKELANKVAPAAGLDGVVAVANQVQQTAMDAKGLYPNVDFYTGIVLTGTAPLGPGRPARLNDAVIRGAASARWTTKAPPLRRGPFVVTRATPRLRRAPCSPAASRPSSVRRHPARG